MRKNKYTIIYTESFLKQFNNTLEYFIYKLQNRIAAKKFREEVITKIEKRSENPESFEKYNSKKKRKDTYYRIYVKNYTVFYTVKGNVMEIRRLIYSKRNYDRLI